MKKIGVFFLNLVLVCVFLINSGTVWAKSYNGDNLKMISNETTFMNEYEQIKKLKTMSDNELKTIGFDNEKISKLRDLDYKKELSKRAKLSDEKLKSMNYTDEKIMLLRNYDESEASTMALAAIVTLNQMLQSSSATKYVVYFSWYWNNVPVWLYTDIIGFAWSATSPSGIVMNAPININGSTYHYVHYIDNYSNTTFTQSQPFEVEDPYKIASTSFSCGVAYGDNYYQWGDNGYGRVEFNSVNNSTIQEIALRIQYGHSSLGVEPGLNVSNSGVNIGVSFTFACSSIASTVKRYDIYGNTYAY